MLTWELVGAVVGAGLASGREIASFFSRFGAWSWIGILLSAAALIFLSDARLPERWQTQRPGIIWRTLLTLLLVVTGGAMLSGAGEIAALTLPMHGAYPLGMIGTFLLAWILANRTASGLAWVSRLMLGALAVLIGLGFTLSSAPAVRVPFESAPSAVLSGLTYGGFNASLQVPILAAAPQCCQRKKQAAAAAALVICLLLLVGNAVLLRSPALIDEPMPFLHMVGGFGKLGYWIGSASLYLAVLSTLIACFRGTQGRVLPALGILLISMLGFSSVVERCYPLLGGACFLMLCAAKLLKYF